jgi:uncharacterized membrane protein
MGLLTMLYSFAVYFGTHYLELWKIASIVFVLLGIRLIASYTVKHWNWPLLMVGMVYCGFAIWSNELLTLRFYPAIANAAMLLLFSWSLVSPPSLIERLGRIQHPDLPPMASLSFIRGELPRYGVRFLLSTAVLRYRQRFGAALNSEVYITV